MRLEQIHGPQDLKGLSLPALEALAEEIRQVILQTVAGTGGHLGPNLGTVELTLALHTVFNSPRDVILWDVSHQSYPHKLITGRRAGFARLRAADGVAGFTDPAESEHDYFHWGHASTSISAALGMARARDLKGEDHAVVAVIGDGAMTGGMAFEALNHAGHDKTKLIVVLNDNSMSIAANVGALAHYLAKIRTGPQYNRVKHEVRDLLKRIPLVGAQVFDWVDRLKEGVKHLLVEGMLFENLGFTYMGPIDGHNIAVLQQNLRAARAYPGPVLLHVVTTKGKGYAYAEEAGDRMHGGGPFDLKTGRRPPATVPTYSEVFGAAITEVAAADARVVAVTAAMPDGTGLGDFARRFPDRFFDVGIAEQHATTFCAGLARAGMRPVFAVYSTFLQRGYDQVMHDVCLQGLPVTFALDRAGLVEDGATHHGLFDVAYLRCLPGVVIMAPKDENELRHMLATALSHDGPAVLRYPRGKAQGVAMDANPTPLPIGRAERLRDGDAAAIVALGAMVAPALAAADLLAAEGIAVQVLNARCAKPLDAAALTAAARTGAVVTVEEAALTGGFGSAVLECLHDHGLNNVKLRRLGVPDDWVGHGAPQLYHEDFGLDAAGIARAVKDLIGARSGDQRRRRSGGRVVGLDDRAAAGSGHDD